MPKVGKIFGSFQGLLWLGCAAAAIFLLGYPLAENLWAYYTWQAVPCWVPEGSDRYFFKVNDVEYLSNTRDFWEGLDLHALRAAGSDHPGNNDTCYVRAADPVLAVKSLDAHKHLDRAAARLGVVGLLIVATGILSFATRKKSRPAQSSPAVLPRN